MSFQSGVIIADVATRVVPYTISILYNVVAIGNAKDGTTAQKIAGIALVLLIGAAITAAGLGITYLLWQYFPNLTFVLSLIDLIVTAICLLVGLAAIAAKPSLQTQNA